MIFYPHRPRAARPRASRTAGLAALLACATGLLLAAARPAIAQQPDTRIITFQDAVRIALERNATLRRAQNTAELDAIAVEEARNSFLPDLRFSTQGAQSFGRNFSDIEGRILDRSTRSVNMGLNSSVVLFNGFGNVASYREARLSEQASRLDLQRSEETVVFTVAANFLALIQQREQLRVQRENLEAELELERQIRSFVDAGRRTIADLYQQQASVASARFAVVEAERAVELAEVDLMQTLQLDPRGVYEFVVPELGAETVAGERLQLASLVERALEQRVDVEAVEARLDAAAQSVRIARAGRWPTVSLSAGYSSNYNSASDVSFSEQLDQRRGGSIGINFTIPLFDRGNVAIATRRAEIAQDNARLELENLLHEVGLQVRRAVLDYEAAQEQLRVAETQLQAAELALEATQERYNVGAATLVELSQARAAHVRAASSLVSARYNLLFQRTLVDYYVGDLDPSRLAGERGGTP
ncbi:MAG: TolC family protein [Pseudomonadota bacterium]|jgi:Outer membrane protein|nr:MAG: TolC family protein [Pseudomonadota bacterium]